MSEFGPDIAPEVFAACEAGAAEAASALGRAFDGQFALSAAPAESIDPSAPPEGLTGPGLVFVLKAPGGAALVALAESSGLVPDWCAAPDATGVSKLDTLAQELGMVLLPEEHMPLGFQASRVDDLQAALQRGGPADGVRAAPLALSSGDKNALLYLVWPLADPDAVIVLSRQSDAAQADDDDDSGDKSAKSADASKARSASSRFAESSVGLERLPPYAKSLLRIKVPVVVRLASTKQPVRRIVELGPGSIIQFAKRCDETLNLEIGGQDIAEGEAVKVGDKFGLRITSVILPEEKFIAVRGRRDA